VRGDLGESISRNEPARDAVAEALGNTLKLALAGFVIALVVGIGAGMAMGWWAGRRRGRALNLLMVSGASVPQFWFGLILLYFFAIKWQIFPTGGMGPTRGDAGLAVQLKYLTLPAITVAVLPAAIISRLTRTLILEIRSQDFVTTLRTRGYSTLRIWRHVLRNAAAGIVNIIGLQAGYILLGTLFTEIVFSWPGLGTLVMNSIAARDYPVIQAIVLISGFIFATITVLADIGMRALDPRVEAT
jgi:peptide/nickel transport system permease protein